MNILVCISKAPDTTTKIAFKDGDTRFNEDNVTFILNPYDEWYALVRALELKETLGGNVTVLHVGPASSEPEIRKALAIGADEAVRIDLEAQDAGQVAAEVAAYVQGKSFDLIMVGKETINYNGASVGGFVAGYLGWPYVSMATKLDVAGSTATIEHDVEGGTEVLEGDLPLVISCAKGMAEARIPNMRGIMAARTKPLQVVASSGTEALTSVVKYAVAPGRTAVKLIDPEQMDQLVELLHNEAKVI